MTLKVPRISDTPRALSKAAPDVRGVTSRLANRPTPGRVGLGRASKLQKY